jgi:tetrahydromethanopterin S-methyltransferase subunit B
MKRTHLLAVSAGAAVIALTGAGFATQSAFAAESTTGKTLTERIAERFNLNKDDVQKVVDEHRAERETQMKAKMDERLTQAVTDGKITQEQKDKVIAKSAEIKTKMDEIRAMTDDAARKAAMDALRTETQTWAKDNGIPERLIGPMGGHGKGGHRGGPRGGDMTPPADAPTAN